MPDYLTTCERAARAAGTVLLQWRGRFSVREKGPADLVTEADVAAQNVIRKLLHAEFPQIDFVGEESPAEEQARAQNAPLRWIVDPLDGTTNYVHGLPGWCVSIALAEGESLLAGCVFDPISDDLYLAAAGEGAHCNGVRLHTSDNTTLGQSLVAMSFPATASRQSPEIECFLEMLPHIQAFRRLGSAALNLCHIAAGQIDANWAASVNSWDVAAGILLVREAGGVVTGLRGEPYRLAERHLAAAANSTLHEAFTSILRQSWPKQNGHS
jgi:myo-inositol-1(or 4)-monophosphatase